MDEQLGGPRAYLTVRPHHPVYDLYRWLPGRVVEPRIAATRDELFDGLVVDFRGTQLFVDAPEVRAIHEGVVVLELTVADLAQATNDPGARPQWPGGPVNVRPRSTNASAAPDDEVALLGALSRMYAADAISLETLERETERVLRARAQSDLDAIAAEVLPVPPAPARGLEPAQRLG